jgi:uncharacterized protein
MTLIAIRLTPKASANRIGEARTLPDGTEQLAVYVTAVPENGKANEAMIRLLSKHLNIAAGRIRVIRGATSRNKIIEIS